MENAFLRYTLLSFCLLAVLGCAGCNRLNQSGEKNEASGPSVKQVEQTEANFVGKWKIETGSDAAVSYFVFNADGKFTWISELKFANERQRRLGTWSLNQGTLQFILTEESFEPLDSKARDPQNSKTKPLQNKKYQFEIQRIERSNAVLKKIEKNRSDTFPVFLKRVK